MKENIKTLVNQQYTDNYMGWRPVQIPNSAGPKILKAYLGNTPGRPGFGQITALFEHEDDIYVLRFHVWAPHQPGHMANRLTEIKKLKVRSTHGIKYLEAADTDFGVKAFWLYTPESELDENSLLVRQIAKALKRYSVENQLCKNFRKSHKGV